MIVCCDADKISIISDVEYNEDMIVYYDVNNIYIIHYFQCNNDNC